jgi:hypothetical protein
MGLLTAPNSIAKVIVDFPEQNQVSSFQSEPKEKLGKVDGKSGHEKRYCQ